jgi:hypothetical protein
MPRQLAPKAMLCGLVAATLASLLFFGPDESLRSVVSVAQAACVDGTITACKIGNQVGSRECLHGRLLPCDLSMPPPPPPGPPLPPVTQIPGLFDLVPSEPSKPTDDNGLILNPKWRWQTISPNLLPSPGDASTYCGSLAWKAPCTSYPTTNDNWSAEKESVIVGLEGAIAVISVGFGGGDATNYCGSGHQNWMPVTYSGTIFWEAHSSPKGADDDYNFRLVPPAVGKNSFGTNLGGGLTDTSDSIYPTTGEVTSPPENSVEVWPLTKTPVDSTTALPSLEVEFDSEETVDNFSTTWWSSFHNAVDNAGAQAVLGGGGPSVDCYSGDTSTCAKLATLENMINGKFAIVTGLFGLDCAHDCKPELHPVFAMAIRIQDDPSDEVWEIFARRSGDEGFCSSQIHVLNALPNDTYTIRFPSRGTSVEVTQHTLASADSSITVDFPVLDPKKGKLVSFLIPPPTLVKPLNILLSDVIHGEVHLRWSGVVKNPTGPFHSGVIQPAGGTPAHSAKVQVIAPGPIKAHGTSPERPEKPEGRIDQLVATMTPAQRDIFFAKFPVRSISKHVSPVRVGAPLVAGPKAHPAIASAVINSAQHTKDQQLIDALHAVYGPKLDQNLPTGFKPKPVCHHTARGVSCPE